MRKMLSILLSVVLLPATSTAMSQKETSTMISMKETLEMEPDNSTFLSELGLVFIKDKKNFNKQLLC
jgi:hypothetical protein